MKNASHSSRSVVKTTKAPAPGGHYSQAIRVGSHVYVSGSGPFDPKTHQVVGKNAAAQTRQTLQNIRAILNAASVDLKDVVKVTIYLKDMRDFNEMDKTYRTFFPQHPPARTTVQVGLYGRDRLIAADAIAIKPQDFSLRFHVT